jgi:hypothetical protein
LTPPFALAVVELSKIKDLPLDKLSAPSTAILDDVPVTMLFAVFESRVALQKHYAHRFYSWFLYLSASAGNFSQKIAGFPIE